MAGRIALIWNPAAGRATPEKLEEASGFLSSRGFEVEKMATGKRGDAEIFAKEAAAKGCEFIVAAGGDGTINEVVQSMAFGKAKLGIIPLGTVNVLAKELGIPTSFRKSLACFAEGRARTISLGRATIQEGRSSRFFILMAGIGFDAEVVEANNADLKKKIGRLSYLATAGRRFFKNSPEKLRFDIERDKITGFHAVIGKASRYGGNFKITRNASLFDPDLHAVIIKSPKRRHLLKLALFALTGTLPYFEGSEFKVARVVGVEGRAKIQLDGDYFGETPCRIESAENCLTVIA